MLTRALRAGVNAGWVAADEVYGADPGLRAECELAGLGYVLAVGCDRRIPTAAGPVRADVLAAELPRHAWQRLWAGPGAKGERVYEWAWIDHTTPAVRDDPFDSRRWSLLVRRHHRTGELAFYRCYSPDLVPLRELVRVAGRRWSIEEAFQTGKGLTGLDEHQVRRWTSWQRWTVLVMLAHALITVIAADVHHDDQRCPGGVIALTRNEIRRLLARLVIEPGRRIACPLAWSRWRRGHQHHARTSHYARRDDDQQP
jgi:SRSO17 transposase